MCGDDKVLEKIVSKILSNILLKICMGSFKYHQNMSLFGGLKFLAKIFLEEPIFDALKVLEKCS